MTSSVEQARTVQVRNKFGLHARPAAEFVKLANQFKSEIMVRKHEVEVNGKSIMGMMMLAAECGVEITVRASGPDAEKAVNELVQLVETGFGEG
ncbi:MAG TPA: HPr family phosphocarrier protein [Longimicrobiales bacterium]